MEGFLSFLKKSPTAFHAVKAAEEMLNKAGFIKLNENQKWNLKCEGKYYISRNLSSILAFTIPANIDEMSFNIVATHTDSPTFKLKPNFTIDTNKYIKLNTEVYGGPIYNTWMDRPLNIAGKIIVKGDNGIESKLISFDKPMVIIPNCSIHYYPELNKGVALNPQNDLLPILCDKSINDCDLLALIANKLNINKNDIISHDLYLALLDRGTLGGANDEFIMAPQIDNLECSYIALNSFINSTNTKSANVLALFDNEEIGSRTRQGAASTMLADILERISISLNKTEEEHKMALANSFIISADNAQGYHPNYPQKFDQTNAVYLNNGIVIKNAARGSYSTDAISQAFFKVICERANAKYQLNTNRSDIPGGSTLGCISIMNVSIHSVDIGLPQLAMHSAYETAGKYDYFELNKALIQFYQSHLVVNEDGNLSF
ncbi:MAG: M18 family aminopeptidase [Acholeplasmatales bacterium]|nr:M18 family aminopeptidase [Acholeplasmatales bacterium]